MSYFLCLAVPPEAADLLPRVFDSRIYRMEATDLPIGEVTRGENRDWIAVILQVGSSSASLFGKAGLKRTHNNDHSGLFVAGLRALLEREECASLSFLVHWFRGYLTVETIALQGERSLELLPLAESIIDLEEDVRYTVFARLPAEPTQVKDTDLSGSEDAIEVGSRQFGPRVMRHVTASGGDEFAIHEVYYLGSEDEEDWGWTQDALSPRAASVAELKATLMALAARDQEVSLGDLGYTYSKEDIDWWLEHIDESPIDFVKEETAG